MEFRKAAFGDIPAVAKIYEEIHTEQENKRIFVGWIREIYPTEQTAETAWKREDLFVLEENGELLGAAVINQIQVDVYAGAPWRYPAREQDVMVLHTLVISPRAAGKGYGTAFVRFYEDCARRQGCPYLRMDTNAGNARARALYAKLGYTEIGIVPCVFNGIEGVPLVLLEKCLDE